MRPWIQSSTKGGETEQLANCSTEHKLPSAAEKRIASAQGFFMSTRPKVLDYLGENGALSATAK